MCWPEEQLADYQTKRSGPSPTAQPFACQWLTPWHRSPSAWSGRRKARAERAHSPKPGGGIGHFTPSATREYEGDPQSDNTSIWIVQWHPRTVFFAYPKGSAGGLNAVSGNLLKAFINTTTVS